jgi:hypothetical protein
VKEGNTATDTLLELSLLDGSQTRHLTRRVDTAIIANHSSGKPMVVYISLWEGKPAADVEVVLGAHTLRALGYLPFEGERTKTGGGGEAAPTRGEVLSGSPTGVELAASLARQLAENEAQYQAMIARQTCPLAREVLLRHRAAFQLPCYTEAQRNDEGGVRIETNEHARDPWRVRPQRLSGPKGSILSTWVTDLAARGLIERCHSPTPSPIVITKKETPVDRPQQWRFVLDDRQANDRTTRPQGRTDGVAWAQRQLARGTHFFVADLSDSYWQIKVHHASRNLGGSFLDAQGRTWRFVGATQGGSSSGYWLREAIYDALGPLIDGGADGAALPYADDLIGSSFGAPSCARLLDETLTRLTAARLFVSAKKFQHGTTVTWLGTEVSAMGRRPTEAAIAALLDLASPRNTDELYTTLGGLGAMRSYVHDFGTRARAMTRLLRKDATWTWSDVEEAELRAIIATIARRVRVTPFDATARTIVATDASFVGMGATLSQMQPHPISGKEWRAIVAFWSKAFTDDKSASFTSSHEPELRAVDEATRAFGPYLEQLERFELETDSTSVQQALNNGSTTSVTALEFPKILARISALPIVKPVRHVSGRKNEVPDMLSRTMRVEAGASIDVLAGDENGEAAAVAAAAIESVMASRAAAAAGATAEAENLASDENGEAAAVAAAAIESVMASRAAAAAGVAADAAAEGGNNAGIVGGHHLAPIRAGIDDETYAAGLRDAPSYWRIFELVSQSGAELGAGAAAVSTSGLFATLEGRLYILEAAKRRWLLVVAGGAAKKAAVAWAHDTLGVHMGRDATYVRLSESVFMAGAVRAVAAAVAACIHCKQVHGAPVAAGVAIVSHDRPSLPGQHIAIDLVTGLPRTEKGNDAFITIVDLLTGEIELTAIPKASSAVAVIDSLKRWWGGHGVSDVLRSDRDRRMREWFREVMRSHGVEHRITVAYNPGGNGAAEVANRLAVRAIRSISLGSAINRIETLIASGEDWDEQLWRVAVAINSMPRAANGGRSPFELARGYAMSTGKGDTFAVEEAAIVEARRAGAPGAAAEVASRSAVARHARLGNMARDAMRVETKHAPVGRLAVGEVVMVRLIKYDTKQAPDGERSLKLAPRLHGPTRIAEIGGGGARGRIEWFEGWGERPLWLNARQIVRLGSSAAADGGGEDDEAESDEEVRDVEREGSRREGCADLWDAAWDVHEEEWGDALDRDDEESGVDDTDDDDERDEEEDNVDAPIYDARHDGEYRARRRGE